MKTGIPTKDQSALLLIDIQERLMPVIHEKEKVIEASNKLIEGMQILQVPILVTEQYPKGLGKTCPELSLPGQADIIEKMCFSCMLSDEMGRQLEQLGSKHLIVAGVEAHICVLKTVLDALERGYEVHVVADAVSSRTQSNKQLALERMRQAGAYIVSTEMILFQLIDEAGTDQFKAISRLIR